MLSPLSQKAAMPYEFEIPEDITVPCLLNSMEAGYIIVNNSSQVIFFNKAFETWYKNIFGISPVKNQQVSNLFQKNESLLQKYFSEVFSDKSIAYEIPIVTNKQEKKWFFLRFSPLKNPQNKITAAIIHISDVSSKKDIESELKHSNERYEYVSKITSDAIWDWDLKTNSLFWSDGYETTFGYKLNRKEDNIGLWESRIFTEDKNRVVKKLNFCLTNPEINYWEDEYRYLKADGSIAYIYDRGHIIHENKQAVRMVGAMTDITSKKISEMEKEQITSELVERNKDLEQFAFIISHNIRSQISNSISLTYLLSNKLLQTEEEQPVFEQLNNSLKKLDEIVQDINQVIHVKRNVEEKKEEFDCYSLLNDVIQSLQTEINENDVEINIDIKDVSQLKSIKSYFTSIFYNLISNSIKYRNPAQKPVINLEIFKLTPNIIIKIKDNGLGINLEKHGNNVFGLYKRFHTNADGKGMGLYMVKTQVESLSGKISVESQPLSGTTFTIKLPQEMMQ